MRKIGGRAVVVAIAVAAVIWLQAGDTGCPRPAAARAAAAVTAIPRATPVSTANDDDGATTSTTYTVTAGGLPRAYDVITPVKALRKTAPIIVMLAGIEPPFESGASVVDGEIARDDLLPYAASGKAELVYPQPLYGSWNAGPCCSEAATKDVNDLAFLKAVAEDVDPGHTRQIDLVGYSNGARLAYRAACEEPGIFNEYAMIKGEPEPGCVIPRPMSILQVASVNDPEVPYTPGDHGLPDDPLPMTTLVASLHADDECPAADTVTRSGQLTQTTWSGCAGGTRLALAAWSGGAHSFPSPPASVPAAAQVIWSFFTQTPLAPLPG